MDDADRGFGLVDVLAAGAAGLVGFDAQVFGFDLDIDLLVGRDLGNDVDRRERRVPAVLLVERRHPHEAVDAALALEHAVGVLPADEDRDRFQARLFRRRLVGHVRREPLALGPPQVHASQHLGPIGRVDTAGARVDRDDGPVVVVLAIEVCGHLEPVDAFLRGRDRSVHLFRRAGLIAHDLQEFARVGQLPAERPDLVRFVAQIGQALHRFLRRVGIAPEILGPRTLIEFGYGPELAVVVKDAP